MLLDLLSGLDLPVPLELRNLGAPEDVTLALFSWLDSSTSDFFTDTPESPSSEL